MERGNQSLESSCYERTLEYVLSLDQENLSLPEISVLLGTQFLFAYAIIC